jgi:hypothetical protein
MGADSPLARALGASPRVDVDVTVTRMTEPVRRALSASTAVTASGSVCALSALPATGPRLSLRLHLADAPNADADAAADDEADVASVPAPPLLATDRVLLLPLTLAPLRALVFLLFALFLVVLAVETGDAAQHEDLPRLLAALGAPATAEPAPKPASKLAIAVPASPAPAPAVPAPSAGVFVNDSLLDSMGAPTRRGKGKRKSSSR